MQDYYSILKVDPYASFEEVRAAYKRLAILTHPDRSRHPQATQQMQLINEAFEVLGDREKRSQYDRDRLAAATLTVVPQPANPSYQPAVDQTKQGNPQTNRKGWLRGQLKILWYLTLLTIAFFISSLVFETISSLVNLFILMIVLLVVLTLGSMILGVRNLER